MAASRVAVFLAYQNVHLMAHGLFMPKGAPVHDALVHPLRVAERLVAKRKGDNELSSVRVFRSRPNPGYQPIPAAANDAQTAAWEREDPRLRVIRRDLNYRGWPEHPPQEKGVDVALAIALVESAYGSRPRWLLADGSRGVTSSDNRTSMPCVIRRSTPQNPGTWPFR